ncbi:MAG TPA: CmcJ/NvfI family oxidoreductase [Stellaceae bacterium]|nr:CmcJ/NvfI family oxidoreductase [Stellaceae bacterium]
MAQIVEPELAPDTIEATVNYLRDTGEQPFTYTGGPGSTDIRSGGTPDPRQVTIRNARPLADRFALERNGFRFLRHDTAMRDFFDEAEIQRVYYPEMEALVKAEIGATRVVVFDHTLRTADDEMREARKIREVVRRVHNDYTEWSGPQRVRDLLADEADALLQHRFAIVQVWRPIRHPVETFPLALCDARSMSPKDFVVSERRYPNRVGQTYAVTYNPEHEWYWLPRMRRDEAVIFKVFDSLKDGRARWTAHTAFDDPTTPANARPRESIEIRTLAFFPA